MSAPRQRPWAAQWIWAPEARYPNAHVLFRKDFDLATVPDAARGFIAAETFARVWLNGQEIHRTGSISYPGQQNFETIDLRRHLRAGTNQLAVLAWWPGVGCTSTWGKDPGLLCEIEVQFPGRTHRIGTDDTWQTLPLTAWTGGIRSRMFNLDLQEILDYRQLPEGFPFPADTSPFRPAEGLREPGVRMGVVEERDFPPPVSEGDAELRLLSATLVKDCSEAASSPAMAVSQEELLSPVTTDPSIAPPPPGHAMTLVYDLGAYHIGYPVVTVDAPAGTVADIAWCEALHDGHFKVPGTPLCCDRYILAGAPTTVTPEEWKAGKYLQVTLRRFDRPIGVNVRFAVERYPLKRRIQFSSSDERLNEIVRIGLRSTQLCMHDRIMDCPWRERRVWIGDVQRIALINYYAFDDQQLIRHTLRQQARLQDPTGRVWVCIPLMEELPTQSLEWVRAILEYQHYTGDATLLDELRDNIEWLHRWFLKCRDGRGLFFQPRPPVWNWQDNTLSAPTKEHQNRTPLLASNLRYLMFLDDIAQLVPAAADQARSERRRLERLIVPSFLDRRTNLLRELADPEPDPIHAEYSAALAVNARLPDFDTVAHFDAVMAHPQMIPASPFGKYQTFEALGALGRVDAILRHLYEGWGPMIDAGSDTAWEWFPPRVSSYCHGWSGIPIVALLRHVLKVDPRRPAPKRIENVAGIAWMQSH